MNREYEKIKHEKIKYINVFLVELDYRTPHIHRDFEICQVMDGEITVISGKEKVHFSKNDYFIINPFQPHEIIADTQALILSLQIQKELYQDYYPQINNIEFRFGNYMNEMDKKENKTITDAISFLANSYFENVDRFQLICIAEANWLFYLLLGSYPIIYRNEKKQRKLIESNIRMQRIIDYIDSHYTERIFLTDIAKKEKLSMTYLSHFFKDNFQMTFQNYVMSLRCEKARQLLLLTDLNLLNISMECGFSDVKYLNSGFKKQYGHSPKEYRKNFNAASLPEQQRSILSTQRFLSAESSLVLLKRFYES